MGESKRELAIRMLKENACMFNSCLAKDELKHFKNYDFVQYLINCLSIPEHNYNNCHNATCRRKCRKDGYEQAINDFVKSEDCLMEKIKEEKAEVSIDYEWRKVVCLDDIRRMLHQGLLETAEQLKAGVTND